MELLFLEQPQQIQIMREKLGIPEPREGLHRFFVLGGVLFACRSTQAQAHDAALFAPGYNNMHLLHNTRHPHRYAQTCPSYKPAHVHMFMCKCMHIHVHTFALVLKKDVFCCRRTKKLRAKSTLFPEPGANVDGSVCVSFSV